MDRFIVHFVRKQKYGGKGWAFDCDRNYFISDDKMAEGYNDMIAQCQTYIEQHNLDIEVEDMFDVWERLVNMDYNVRKKKIEDCEFGVWYDVYSFVPAEHGEYLVITFNAELEEDGYDVQRYYEDKTGETWFHDNNGEYDPNVMFWAIIPSFPAELTQNNFFENSEKSC